MSNRQTFLQSLVLSVAVNLAVFAVLQPIRVQPGGPSRDRYDLHQLKHVRVSSDGTTAAIQAPTTPPDSATAPHADRTPPAWRRSHSTRVAALPRPGARSSGGGSPSGGGRPVLPAPEPLRLAQALGPTGGDGTARTPLTPRAGGGAALTARPRELGDVPNAAGPGLAGAAATRTPYGRNGVVRDGPPLLTVGLGANGGLPTAPMRGRDPLAGTAGSGDRPTDTAPMSLEGYAAPLAPTTPGPRLRTKAGPGLPAIADAPVVIAATPVDANGRSGGGGGTARAPGLGGGGPAGLERVRSAGGGGSGLAKTGPQPGGVAIGPGPGGSGGGGNGLGTVGNGGTGTDLQPAATVGSPSVIRQPGRGEPGGTAVRPGKRTAGPGGAPAMLPEAPVDEPRAIGPGSGGPGGSGGGHGGGHGKGRGKGDGGGSQATVAGRGKGGSGYTGVVFDTLSLTWHHYPTSFDLRVGSVTGPRLASINIQRYPSVAAASASERVQRDGRRNVLVITPTAIEYVAANGAGARHVVVISGGDAAQLKSSGLLKDRGRIVTVYKNNY